MWRAAAQNGGDMRSLPGRVDVLDAKLDEDGAVLAGHRGGGAEHPDGRRGADRDGPAGVLSSAKTGDGPGGGQAGHLLPEGREALATYAEAR